MDMIREATGNAFCRTYTIDSCPAAIKAEVQQREAERHRLEAERLASQQKEQAAEAARRKSEEAERRAQELQRQAALEAARRAQEKRKEVEDKRRKTEEVERQEREAQRRKQEFYLKGDFGSLGFDGRYTISEADGIVIYDLKELVIRFIPNSWGNRVDTADLKTIQIVAGRRIEGKHNSLFHYSQAVAVKVNAASPIAQLRDLQFRVPKSAVERAEYVGLGISDGHLMWAIPTFERFKPGQ